MLLPFCPLYRPNPTRISPPDNAPWHAPRTAPAAGQMTNSFLHVGQCWRRGGDTPLRCPQVVEVIHFTRFFELDLGGTLGDWMGDTPLSSRMGQR